MSNYDVRATALNGLGGTSFSVPAYGNSLRSVAYKRFSFADLVTAPVQNDVVVFMTIPAKSRVHSANLVVVTPEGEASTIHIGDYSDLVGSAVDADGWLKGVSINGVAGTGGGTGGNTEAYGAAGGKFYAAEAYMAITCPDNLTYNTAVVDIWIDITKYYDEEGD